MSLSYNFTGKTVLVTGGSMGFGLQLVKSLAESGARVISLSRTTVDLEILKKEKPNYSIDAIKCDVSNWTELERVAKSLPVVDCLVNNAAAWTPTAFGEISLEQIDSTFDTNVKAIINLSQVLSNVWKSQQIKGVIVNISSITSMKKVPNISVYCATKEAVDSITRSMALELGPHGIRVNSVNPTVIPTKLSQQYFNTEERCNTVISHTPLGRLGDIIEAVDVIMYLLTDRCTLVTGTSILVDGGYCIG